MINPLTLKELPAGGSGGGLRQSQPHNGVGSLFDTAQPLPHHPVELRHRFRNGCKKKEVGNEMKNLLGFFFH